ncbi:MAG: hypothetical protein QOG43_1978 [Actinomycetota bacterium]|nr:hypothetical protein [Actinomycetota bacterium]
MIQWGYCRGYKVRAEASYRVGDAVRWRVCADGNIHAWSFFDTGEGNIGDPAFRDLILRDYWREASPHSCGQEFGGVAVQIRHGLVTRAWAYLPGELDNSSRFYIVDAHEVPTPMPEWDDVLMNWVDLSLCGHEVRLVV